MKKLLLLVGLVVFLTLSFEAYESSYKKCEIKNNMSMRDYLFANSIVALRASTGELVWYFQIVHHDVWDYDLPAQPIVTTINQSGKLIPVVVQLTKQGLIFILHRDTGKPFFPIEERAVPTDGVPGDILSSTQPFPVLPPPLVKQSIEPSDSWGFTFYDKRKCREHITLL